MALFKIKNIPVDAKYDKYGRRDLYRISGQTKAESDKFRKEYEHESKHITDKDIIIGKCNKVINSDGKEVVNVTGETIKKGTYGIVDKVIVTKNNRGLRTCKIRIKKIRPATSGDKFTSRRGQKGICGMVIEDYEMPFTNEGIILSFLIANAL